MQLKNGAFCVISANGTCSCFLCPHRCLLRSGEYGMCRVRRNIDGKLISYSYGRVVAANIDPVEKKPLAHFMPATKTFSIGTLGCNLKCEWCQNDSLSGGDYGILEDIPVYTPSDIVKSAMSHGAPSISYTYNEPTVFAEFAIDCAEEAHAAGLKNILVTNGFITPEAAVKLYENIDAANFDVKGFTENFYRKYTGGGLKEVLASIKYFYTLGKHIELTMLIIPTLNDASEQIIQYINWVKSELSPEVTLHFSAFHPACRQLELPRTKPQTLFDIRTLANSLGMKNIELGNI